MSTLFMIVLLFPILFMIHEFEEIAMINVWQKRNEKYIKTLESQNKKVPFVFKGSTASFSLGILEEFLILSIITVTSYLFNNYVLFYGLFIAVTLHFFMHIFFSIHFKGYVPGITTTIILTPFFCFMIYKLNIILHYNTTTSIFAILIATLLMIVNLYMLHNIMIKFTELLNKYASNL